MIDFATRYAALNEAQKKAVDTIDGPVMVVAGPGTGKTELLSVRAANILRQTDELPGNILCLTFTESGASAMRERLIKLIGPEAYKIAIHTFHSFGSAIIGEHGKFFYHGAHFRPSDELSSYEILREIFEKLPYSNPLSVRMNDDYTYLRDVQKAISDLKKSGLVPEELNAVLERGITFVEWLQPKLQQALGERLSKKSFVGVKQLLDECEAYQEEPLDLISYQPLHELFTRSLSLALNSAEDDNSTKPLSAWKRDWCEKRADNELTLKDEARQTKLSALSGVYYEYLVAMQARELFDFDDMILRVVHGMEVYDELRYNLQEQYHYILVDEFQDTNDAQMRMVWNLTNNPVSNGRPNLLVVGDDDQAIYRFQGANISNILNFRELYRDVELITLRDNYRSIAPVLTASRELIVQGSERLENVITELDKKLVSHTENHGEVTLTQYESDLEEYTAIAERLAARDTNRSYAIIARNHRQLRALLPHLQARGLPLKYESQDNIFDDPAIRHLELLTRIVHDIAHEDHDVASHQLPELLAHPLWGVSTTTLWQLSLAAKREHHSWLEIMASDESFGLVGVADFLFESARLVHLEPLEYVLDYLLGNIDVPTDVEVATDEHGVMISPLKSYFFSEQRLQHEPYSFVRFLSSMRTLRERLRQYRPDTILNLHDFIAFLDVHRSLNLPIQATTRYGQNESAIELMTAHRSKGLEYDDVSVINLTDKIWGETSRGRSSLIRFPHNLALEAAGDTTDERLRLLYVAMTRAKQDLHLSAHASSGDGKPAMLAAYLVDSELASEDAPTSDIASQTLSLQDDWRAPLMKVSSEDQTSILQPLVDRYALSSTHLTDFLDVTRDGPSSFLLYDLLKFPIAKSPHAAYGTAIHTALRRAHQHLQATGNRRPQEDVLGDFEAELRGAQLSALDLEHFLDRGTDALNIFLRERYDSFTPDQVSERDFKSEGICLAESDTRLTGAVDLMEIDEQNKTIIVTDYKTGKASLSWKGKTELEKIKLHRYRQQLMFYKLLIENSRQYQNYTVNRAVIEYVEPDKSGAIIQLEMEYDKDELAEFQHIIAAVWQRIQQLNFQTPEMTREALQTILDFEADLLT